MRLSEHRHNHLKLITGGPELDAPGEDDPRALKAQPFEIPSDATVEQLVDAALRECLRHLLANRAPVLEAADPEGLHQLRVGIRRFRSALILFEAVLDRDSAEPLREELRWVARRLSPARDWDVFASGTLADVMKAAPGDAGLCRLVVEAELRRRAAYERARKALASPRFERLEENLQSYVNRCDWRSDGDVKRTRGLRRRAVEASADLLEGRLLEVMRLGTRAEGLSRRDLHRLRIAVKELRYACEFLAPVHPGARARRFVRRLEALQDLLGHINDGRVAEELVDALVEEVDAKDPSVDLERAAGLVIGWAHCSGSEGRPRILKAWQRFDAARPFWTSTGPG
jgi:CHAD domain-containing protein